MIQIFLLLCLLPGLCLAETPLTIREACARVLLYNAELAAFSYEIRASDAEILQASLYPNPVFSIECEDFAGQGQYHGFDGSQTTIQYSQLIELGCKRATRIVHATWNSKVATLAYEMKKYELIGDLASRFVEVLYMQQKVDALAGVLQSLREFLPITKKRLEQGKASILEESKFQIAIATAAIDLEGAEMDLTTARQKMAALWNEHCSFYFAKGDLRAPMPALDLCCLGNLIANHPILLHSLAETSKSKALVKVEAAKGVPDLTASLGPRYHADSHDHSLVGMLTYPLPLYDRNQGSILAAAYKFQKGEDDYDALHVDLQTQLSEAYYNLIKAGKEIAVLQSAVLPSAARGLENAREGYKVGRYSYIEIIDAQRTHAASQLQHLQALREYNLAAAKIETLTGTCLYAN